MARQRYGALNQLVGGFTEGYDSMSRWIREHREEEDRQRQRETRDLIASMDPLNYQSTTAVPSASYRNLQGTDHPGRTTTHQTSPRQITTTDWAKFRQDGMQAYLKSGDVAGAVAWDNYVSGIQHKGAMQNAATAMAALQAGDAEGAAQAMTEASNFFPNGARSMYQVLNGNLVMMGVDEETGKPTGDPVTVNEEYVTGLLQNFQSIDNFLAWTKDRQAMALKREELDALKKHRERTYELTEEEIASRERLARSKSDRADARATTAAADRAATYAQDAWLNMDQAQVDALAAVGITSAEQLAEVAAEVARSNPSLGAAAAFGAAVRRALGGGAAPTGGAGGAVPGRGPAAASVTPRVPAGGPGVVQRGMDLASRALRGGVPDSRGTGPVPGAAQAPPARPPATDALQGFWSDVDRAEADRRQWAPLPRETPRMAGSAAPPPGMDTALPSRTHERLRDFQDRVAEAEARRQSSRRSVQRGAANRARDERVEQSIGARTFPLPSFTPEERAAYALHMHRVRNP